MLTKYALLRLSRTAGLTESVGKPSRLENGTCPDLSRTERSAGCGADRRWHAQSALSDFRDGWDILTG